MVTSVRPSPGTSKAGISAKPPALRKRDANRQTKLTSVVKPSTVSTLSSRKFFEPPVIEVSSDDEDEKSYVPPVVVPRKRVAGLFVKSRDGKGRKGKEEEEEEDVPARLKVENEELKRECKRYKETYEKEHAVTARLMVEKDKAVRRANELENNLKRKAENPTPDYSELDDTISCDICANTMWNPATLPECGHTFCESCLHGWFNTTYARHVTLHPTFLEGPNIPPDYLNNRHVPGVADAIKAEYARWRTRVPQPVYLCPTCRQQVKKRPLEIFFLKDVVRKVAKLMDGNQREGSPGPGSRANREIGSIWDGFFPEWMNENGEVVAIG